MQFLYNELQFFWTYWKSMFPRPWMCLENIAEKQPARRIKLCSFYTMNYSSHEHIEKSMFYRPLMCLENIAEKNLIELICAVFTQWITVLRNILKNQCFPYPKCVCKQSQKKWFIELVCAVFIQWVTGLMNILENRCFPDPKCVWKQSPNKHIQKMPHRIHFCRFYTRNYSS